MHRAYTFWMDTQHFQANILQIKQIWHISQAKVHLQIGRYGVVFHPLFFLSPPPPPAIQSHGPQHCDRVHSSDNERHNPPAVSSCSPSPLLQQGGVRRLCRGSDKVSLVLGIHHQNIPGLSREMWYIVANVIYSMHKLCYDTPNLFAFIFYWKGRYQEAISKLRPPHLSFITHCMQTKCVIVTYFYSVCYVHVQHVL